jgi:hypothetical protein
MRGAFYGKSRAAFVGSLTWWCTSTPPAQDKIRQSVKIRQSSLKRTEPLQDLGVVQRAGGRTAGVGERPRADVMRLPRHLLCMADRGLGTYAFNGIVGKYGAVITPRYRCRKVVDHAFAHLSLRPYSGGERQKSRRRVRTSATASHVGMIRNP